jgi:hypothetical protein
MKGEVDEMVKRVSFNLKQFLQREKGRKGEKRLMRERRRKSA